MEVAHLLEVPLESLRRPETTRRERQTRQVLGEVLDMDVPFFAVGRHQVWGATAMVLSEFLALIDRTNTHLRSP